MVNWYEAEDLCADEGKRLCNEDEWTFACEGEEATPYPYGYTRDATACVIDQPWRPFHESALRPRDGANAAAELDRLWQGVPSGSQPRCRSPFGVYDLTGNVDEWTRTVREGERPSILKGGYWGPVRTRCRPATRSHDENHIFYQQGVRCCSDVGAELGQRAPLGRPVPRARSRASSSSASTPWYPLRAMTQPAPSAARRSPAAIPPRPRRAHRWIDRVTMALLVLSVGVAIGAATPALLRAAGADLAVTNAAPAPRPPIALPRRPPEILAHARRRSRGPPTRRERRSADDRAGRTARAHARARSCCTSSPAGGAGVVGDVQAGELVTILRVTGDWALVYYGGAEGLVVGWAKKSEIAIR